MNDFDSRKCQLAFHNIELKTGGGKEGGRMERRINYMKGLGRRLDLVWIQYHKKPDIWLGGVKPYIMTNSHQPHPHPAYE